MEGKQKLSNKPLLYNPFQLPAEVSTDAPEGSYTYAMVKNGPDVVADECEVAASSVEIMIEWGTSVLSVSHLTPPRSFYVGEKENDFFLPSEKIGAPRAPVVLANAGSLDLVLPRGAKGTIEIAGRMPMTIEEAIGSGLTQPCVELAGAHQIGLPPASKARLEVGDLVFRVSTVNAGRTFGGRFALDTQTASSHGLSAALHVGLLAAAAIFMPPLGASGAEEVTQDQQYLMRQYLAAAAEREPEARDEQSAASDHPDEKNGGTGKRAVDEEGKMGSPTSTATNKHYMLEGPKDNPEPRLANRNAAIKDATDFGMIGILNTLAGAHPDAITAPWGGPDSEGRDPMNARGNMWGDEPGEAAGLGGLGLTGVGEGGGGRGFGVGLGELGTIGRGAGLGDGQGFGNGSGFSHGRLAVRHRVATPSMRLGVVSTNGRLPPEVIQRIVRQNFGRFRFCYENALRNNPSLQGRVAVRFVIGRDGAVSNVGNGGSDLPDAATVSCVARAFYGLSFPAPDGGIVTVTYPIVFSPGT